MKRLFLRLAGAYAGLGVLAFALHRARYIGTSQVRAWTDHRARRVEAELDEMRTQLADLRRRIKTGPDAGAESEAEGPPRQAPRALHAVSGNQDRRIATEAPVQPEAENRQRLAA